MLWTNTLGFLTYLPQYSNHNISLLHWELPSVHYPCFFFLYIVLLFSFLSSLTRQRLMLHPFFVYNLNILPPFSSVRVTWQNHNPDYMKLPALFSCIWAENGQGRKIYHHATWNCSKFTTTTLRRILSTAQPIFFLSLVNFLSYSMRRLFHTFCLFKPVLLFSLTTDDLTCYFSEK